MKARSDEAKQRRHRPQQDAPFGALDADGDGNVSRREFQAAFDKLDANKDGMITASDEPQQRRGSPQQAAPLGALDADGDGNVSRAEYEAMFDMLDADNDGVITVEENENAPAVKPNKSYEMLFRVKARVLLIPTVTVMVLALVLGLILNGVYCGDAWGGCTQTDDSMSGKSLPYLPEHLNNLSACSVSAAVAIGFACLRFALKHGCKYRYVFGSFNICLYIVTLALALHHTYKGTWTAMSTEEAARASKTIRGMLGDDFEDGPTWSETWPGMINAGDFYNWMRGPLMAMLLDGIADREGASDSIPMMLDRNVGTTNGTGATTLSVFACKIRQLRAKLQPSDPYLVEAYQSQWLARLNLTQSPDFIASKTVPLWSSSANDETGRDFLSAGYFENYRSNQNTNAYGRAFTATEVEGDASELPYNAGGGQATTSVLLLA